MMRSLFSGVSGLRNHQVRMDVIGNNISNVNTVAFKAGRVTFKEGFAQLLQGASRPPGDLGGINPIQVGLGMQIGSVDMMFSQGNLESTGLTTDLAIQGDSFFVVKKGTQNYYTRSGNFQLDADGQLVSPTNGFVVQGKMADNGVFLDGVRPIVLPVGQKTAAKATDMVKLAGNLDAAAPIFTGTFNAAGRADPLNVDSWSETSITVFDSLGNQHDLKLQFWKTAADTWSWQVDGTNLPAGFTPPNSTPQTLTFDTTGILTAAAPTSPPVVSFTPAGANQVDVTLDLGGNTVNGITSFAGTNTAVLKDQNGYEAGQLQNFSIDRTGLITGAFTNGTNVILAQIVLADFNNPGGLLRVGDNMYAVSGNSGGAVLGYSLEGIQSTMTSGALEMSNVDLAQEFTNMIVTQRGFQANSRVITSSDEMLQELVNLKR
ncbi:MAG: flagellar hook protein FlgE [Gemmatimonadetes bacterium]|jgi:flagellar hook protein FlgE|nr:flagellar hook protein FlgE [Gemmatimonadota bacterium]MCC7324629.1 flagellar hook protein FlgE [Gemmatimonadaceae bacterium]MBK6458352.1 flagellar hook protein FlgE [Gemmatimonadota bacterium]MBK6843603.1 flagellar hook protein FlgE [Gemmatimonadota bacterium]MBK7833303.1 flagellar hook protein FlgE [Gemmatimonadota bacterium]